MSLLRKKQWHKPKDHDDEDDDNEFEELQNCHSGWLTKKSLLKSRLFWCTLNGRWLSFWKDQSEPQQHPGMNRNADAIDLCSAQQVMRATGTKTPFGFDIVIGKDRTTLLAGNMRECDQWIQNLQTAMQFKIRAASIRKSSHLRQSHEISTPLTESPPNPLYEDVFDPPVAENISTPVTNQLQSLAAAPPPLPTARNPSAVNVESDSTMATSPATAPAESAHRPATLPTAAALYEEVDLKSSDAPQTPSKPQPAARKSLQEMTAPAPHQVKPKPRPSIKKPAVPALSLMPVLDECEDADAHENQKEEEDEMDQEPDTNVVMRQSLANMNEDHGLPNANDLYAIVCKKRNPELQRTNDKVASIWESLEEKKPAHVLSKHEQESQAITELRALLGIPAPIAVESNAARVEHKKLERGQNMQELYNLLFP